jgi:hypothetical protein
MVWQRHRIWLLILVCVAGGCASPWSKHQQQLAQYESAGDWEGAMREARWMIDNALMFAPAEERSSTVDADRHLLLADFATRAGKTREAVEALREALMRDPTSTPSILRKLERLPLSPAERKRIEAEFAWNMAVLAPGDPGWIESQRQLGGCWSYRVRQIRLHRPRVTQTERGREQQVSYDARAWRYDAETGQWLADSVWTPNAGAENHVLGTPEPPRFRAVLAADGGFLSDGAVPPCHREAWRGPYLSDGTWFTTPRLPESPAP